MTTDLLTEQLKRRRKQLNEIKLGFADLDEGERQSVLDEERRLAKTLVQPTVKSVLPSQPATYKEPQLKQTGLIVPKEVPVPVPIPEAKPVIMPKAQYEDYLKIGKEMTAEQWLQKYQQQMLPQQATEFPEDVAKRLFPEYDLPAVSNLIQTNPDEFISQLSLRGSLADQQAILRGLGLSEDEIVGTIVTALAPLAVPEMALTDILELANNSPGDFADLMQSSKGDYLSKANFLEALGFTPEERKKIMGQTSTQNVEYEPSKTVWDKIGGFLSGNVSAPFVFGSRQALEGTRDFFLQTVPNFLFPDNKIYPERYDKSSAGRAALAAEIERNRQNQVARDKFRSWYVKAQEEDEKFAATHPNLTKPEFEDGKTHFDDPAWYAYTIARNAPLTVASLAAGIGVTAATKNPVAGWAAATAVFTPSTIQDVTNDLIASGVSEQQAASMAVPIGLIISSLEGAGEIPLLKQASPTLMKLFKREVTKELGKLTAAQMTKKGLVNFAEVEIAETATEVLQQAIQNATVRVFDPSRSITAGLGVTAGTAAVSTLPFAGFGAAMPSLSQVDVQAIQAELSNTVRENIGTLMAQPERGEIGVPETPQEPGKEVKEPEMAPSTSVQPGLPGVGPETAQVQMFEEVSGKQSVKPPLIDAEAIKKAKAAKPLPGQIALPEEMESIARKSVAGEIRTPEEHRLVQKNFDKYQKALEKVREETAPLEHVAEEEVRQAYEESEMLKMTQELDPVSKERFKLGGKSVDLTAFISLREQDFPQYFTVKQAQALMPGHSFEKYNQPGTKEYNHVPRDVALDDLSKRFNMTPDEIADRVMGIRKERQRLKELKQQIATTPQVSEALPEPTAKQALTPTGDKVLTSAQITKTLELFGQYVESPSALSAWELTQELRRETRAQRAEQLKARTQELLLGGQPVEEAIKQAISDTMAGWLPEARTNYLDDLNERMRRVLFGKVYDVLKDEPYEMMSTVEALTNALLGKPIPRIPGIKGGSALTRLQRVFSDQPRVMKAIELVGEQKKPMSEVMEGVYREMVEGGAPPTPIDEATAEYLRNIPTKPFGKAWLLDDQPAITALSESKTQKQIEAETEDLKIELAAPPEPVTRYEAPIEDAVKELTLWPRPVTDTVIRILKEIGMAPVDIGGLIKAMKSSVDMSYWRQIMPLIPGHPKRFGQSNVDAWKGLFSQRDAEAQWYRITHSSLYAIYDKYQEDFLRPLELPKGTKAYKGVEEFGFLSEERLIPRLTAKIWPIKVSNRGFVSGVNSHLWNLYTDFHQSQLRLSELYAEGKLKLPEGKTFDIEKNLHEYAAMLADWSGRASLGKVAPAAPILGNLFYAPRYALGRLIGPRHLFSSNKYVRAQAWKDAVMFVGVIGGTVMFGSAMDWWDVELDRRSADFGKIRIGNLRIDPWGGAQQFVVFLGRLMDLATAPLTGKPAKIKSSVTGKMIPANFDNLWENFLQGKQAPIIGLIREYMTQKTFEGEKVDVKSARQWLDRFAPMAMVDIYEALKESDLPSVKAISLGALSGLGFGVQTYTGDWEKNKQRLGLPKYPENLEYGLKEPVYDIGDAFSDTVSQFKGVDPATLTPEKGFSEYVRKMVEADRIKDILEQMPNQSLASLNADPSLGATFADYYKMWQDRQALVSSGDEQKLKEFDKDERTRNAKLGNMSQRDFTLLSELSLITDKKDRADFLKAHPELTVNPREEWLKSHSKENGLLSAVGQANVMSQAAYDEAQRLLKDLDIPDSAVKGYLPPKDIVKPYFEFQDTSNKFGNQSWEVKLMLAKDEKLREYLERQPIDEPIKVLELKVKNRTLLDKVDSYSDRESPDYIEDDKARTEAIKNLKADNPAFVDDLRRIEAIEKDGEQYAEQWVERGKLGDEHEGFNAEDKLWLVDNPDVHQWAITNKLLTDDGKDWNVPALRIDVKWQKEDTEYKEIKAPTETEQARLRDEYLATRPEYRKDRRRREAYQLHNPETGFKFPESEIPNYVDYWELPERGYRRERFLLGKLIMSDALLKTGKITLLPDKTKIPSEQWDIITEQNQENFDKLEAISKNINLTEEMREEERRNLRFEGEKLSAFGLAEVRRDAYAKFVPDNQINNYVGYYTIQREGRPSTWPTDLNNEPFPYYEDDWFLMEHLDFYKDVYRGKFNLERKDFSKVPSREVFDKWVFYETEVPKGKAKDDYRFENQDLDEWLYITGKVTIRINEKRRRTSLSPQDRINERVLEIKKTFAGIGR